MTTYDNLAIVVLAAGKGTRMKSDKAKVLHQVAGKSMVCHVVECSQKLFNADVYVVIGHQAEQVKQEVGNTFDVKFALQKQLLGTGDAVKSVVPNINKKIEHVMVLCGDVPLIQDKTLKTLMQGHINSENQVTVLATDMDNPTGYGRIIQDSQGKVNCIREEADASETEKQIQKINTGIYCFEKELLISALEQLKPDNNQAEYYLTDVIEIAREKQKKIGVVTMEDSREVVGVNTLEDLENAHSLFLQMGK